MAMVGNQKRIESDPVMLRGCTTNEWMVSCCLGQNETSNIASNYSDRVGFCDEILINYCICLWRNMHEDNKT